MSTGQFRAGLRILVDEPLKPLTTFKIGGPARYFASAGEPSEIREALAFARREKVPVFVLGGGSNILVSDDGYRGLVLHPTTAGIEETDDGAGNASLRIGAGEAWDVAVAHAVGRDLWGVENLSHIPGQAGAALVQNIGAYGQQLSDVFRSADILELASGEARRLGPEDCDLGYRRSIFNSSRKGECLILGITLTLSRRPQPNLRYPDVRAYFEAQVAEEPSQAAIRAAIISIRDRKFPYPREERGGNAGSFFKNPTLEGAAFQALEARVKKRFGATFASRLGGLKDRARGAGTIKIPAALLIDACGLKGFTMGGAQMNPSQPLVILNLGRATAHDVLSLAGHVRRTVYGETGVSLDLEPELVGFTPGAREQYLRLD